MLKKSEWFMYLFLQGRSSFCFLFTLLSKDSITMKIIGIMSPLRGFAILGE
jgi:hypothetical protein